MPVWPRAFIGPQPSAPELHGDSGGILRGPHYKEREDALAYETLEVEIRERILTVTLNRPERLNAFNVQMLQDLLRVLDQADADDEVRVVIVTGAGRGFCAGADLSRGAGTFDRSDRDPSKEEIRDGGGRLTLEIFKAKKPIIAAINGPAVGIGATMTIPNKR